MNITASISGTNQEPKIPGSEPIGKSELQAITSELAVGEEKILEGEVLSAKDGKVEIRITEPKGQENITLDIKQGDEGLLEVGQNVEVQFRKIAPNEIKVQIRALSIEEMQNLNNTELDKKLDTKGIMKSLYQSNSPLVYASNIERTIEKTAEEIQSFLQQIPDEDLRSLVASELDLSEMTLDLLQQVSYSDQMTKKIKLTEEGVEVKIDDEKVEILRKEFLQNSSIQKIDMKRLEAGIKALAEAEVKLSQSNLEKMSNFIIKLEKVQSMDQSEIVRFLSTDKEATVAELVKSTYFSSAKEKKDVLHEAEFKEIEGKVIEVIQEEFPEFTTEKQEEVLRIAKQLILKGIPFDKRSIDVIRFVHEQQEVITENVDRIKPQVLEKAAQMLAERKRPENLTVRDLLGEGMRVSKEEVEALLKDIEEITKIDARPILSKIIEDGKRPTIREIEAVRDATVGDPIRDAVQDTVRIVKTNATVNTYTEQIDKEVENLEIIRYQMTFKAAMKLKIDGVDVKSMQLSELRDRLEVLQGIKEPKEPVKGEVEVREIYRKLSVIRGSSTKMIVDVALPEVKETVNTIESIYQKVQKGIDRYDQLMTRPRTDLGDRFEFALTKADHLLKDIQLDASPENLRAVEILGRNQIEITPDHVEKVRTIDVQLQRLFQVLKPEYARQLIRENVDILHEPIQELIRKVEVIENEYRIEPEEKLARALHTIMESNKHSDQEKEALISVYKMIYRIERSNNSAVGTLLASGREVNLVNLLQATKYVEKGLTDGSKNTDFRVDQNFGLLENQEEMEYSIKTQIEAVLFQESKEMLELIQEMPVKAFKELMKLDHLNIGEMSSFEQLRKNDFVLKDKVEELRQILTREENPKRQELLKEVEAIFSGKKSNRVGHVLINEDSSVETIKIAKDLEHHSSLLQKLNTQENYTTIPIFINGQYQQMNLYYREQEAKGSSKTDSLRLYLSYSTQHIGRINLRVDMEEQRTKVAYSSQVGQGREILRENQNDLVEIFRQLEFPGVEIEYEDFEVPTPLVKEESKNTQRVLKKYKESRYEVLG